MATILDDRASRLLELLQEADDEAVTLGELEVVGVVEPAEALLALELAGHTFERVYAMGSGERPLECVRLARAGAPAAPRPLNPAPVAARRAAVAEPRTTARPPLAALALLVLAVLLVGLARGAARRR